MENKLEHCYNLEEISVEDINKEVCIKQEIDTFINEQNYFQENVSNEKSTNKSKECIVIKMEKCDNYDNESQASAENDGELERYKQLTLNEDGKCGAFPEIYKSALHRESQENMHKTEKNLCSAEPLQFYIEVELNEDKKCEENMTIKREKVEYEEVSQATNDELEQYSESITVKVECYYSDEELVEEPADEVNGSGENQENTDTRRTTAGVMYQDTRLTATKQSLHKSNLKQRRQKFKTTKAHGNTIGDYEDAVSDEISQDVRNHDIRKKRVHSTNDKPLVGDEEPSEIDVNIYYKCDICGYVTVTKNMLESHMKLHNGKQFYSDDESQTNIHLKKCRHKKTSDKCEVQDVGSSKTRQISEGSLKQLSRSPTGKHSLHVCNLCPFESPYISTLKKHMLKHTGEKRYACNMCTFKSSWKLSLKRHMLAHTGDKPYACNLCPYKTAFHSNLKPHILSHTGEKPYSCNLCSYKSSNKSNLKTHTEKKHHASNLSSNDKSNLKQHTFTHAGKKPYGCILCPYKSDIESHLKKHILTHTHEKPYACNLCPFKSSWKSSLNKHILTHTDDKPYACNLCPYKSVFQSNLKQHILTHTGDKPYSCNLCPYKSAFQSSLKQHILIHADQKPYACNLCPYKSVQKSDLKKHILTHSGQKPYACDLCQYKCTLKSNLKKHILTHTGEKPYTCNLCLYKTTDKSNLKTHIATHTGEKHYACILCPYKSTRRSHLKQHISTHIEKNRYACNLCPYKASWKSSLEQHIERKHACDKTILIS